MAQWLSYYIHIVIWTKLRKREPLTQVCAAVSKKE